ncbi:DNA repair protein rhp57 [Cordyceps militaris CM01]|uniref:DNA repair protein rhp57 n=1 Tax=Cordyceps militaris (strain CM01) TaxID=983644 RepID=G3JEV4_CORMM|nr:DNA repair protein rhp57 [Cordyceps militaris CM01]EGX93447.1 DNA repair protein rhp57 [Cordyceps militaris CM01]
MTDLAKILPSFNTAPFSALLSVVEQHALSTTDLLTQHPVDLAKQTHLALLDLKRFIAAVQASLADDLTPEKPLATARAPEQTAAPPPPPEEDKGEGDGSREPDAAPPPAVVNTAPAQTTPCISTLDDTLDAALGGGVPVGYITEFTGESGAGKTQFLLSLCLAVQLPPPRGLGRQALYVSTEAGLTTRRLAQMLGGAAAAPDWAASPPPSLDHILSTVTPDLESQEHILEYQVPVLLARHDIGLLVLDSVAANYRAEFEGGGLGARLGSGMGARGAQLVRLGAHLRDLARRHGIAVVVANQVADRFASTAVPPPPPPLHRGMPPPESPLASRGRQQQQQQPSSTTLQATPTSSMPMPTPDDAGPLAPPTLFLDHQQRWFTGWGDEPRSSYALKTPSLGLVWSTQISCRVALFKRPVYGRPRRFAAPLDADDDGGGEDREPNLKSWRRWMKVVFAPHVAASGQGIADAVEFEVTAGGLKAVMKEHGKPKS